VSGTLGRLYEYTGFVLTSKGIVGTVLRLGMVACRFDLSGRRMTNAVTRIARLGKASGYKPAIAVPAIVLRRHSPILDHLRTMGIEIAIHGYTHRNFKTLSLERQTEEIRKAQAVFAGFNVPVYGFRAPYLSGTDLTSKAVEAAGLHWESDLGVKWSWPASAQAPMLRHGMVKAIHGLYPLPDAGPDVTIPRLRGKVVSIPLVLPDDEILVDRFGITDATAIGQIWGRILESTHIRGGGFVLQLHPERFAICEKAMETLLRDWVRPKRDIWITSMHEIAVWWKQRHAFGFEFERGSGSSWRVSCRCNERAVILGRNLRSSVPQTPRGDGYSILHRPRFEIQTDGNKPCVGVHPSLPPAIRGLLSDAGYAHEVSESPSGYAYFLEEGGFRDVADEAEVLRKIEESRCPLVRYANWPAGKRSAFTSSHDLDCCTLVDFLWRALGR
jgi:hypothetical protein